LTELTSEIWLSYGLWLTYVDGIATGSRPQPFLPTAYYA